ncbi:MAG: ATPase [Chloroflexota bacterium]
MQMNFVDEIAKIATIDLFKRHPKTRELETGLFVGRPFHLDYDRAYVLIADAWKHKAAGVPQGSFLLAYYENEDAICETLLLRVLRPTKLPTDSDVISSMVEYYKDNLKTGGRDSQLDTFTRYEFSFSGLECRILGTFYVNDAGRTQFGADVENFYSAHNYSIIKPNPTILEAIVNFREGDRIPGEATDVPIGNVRYSSSLRFQTEQDQVPVFVSPQDFLGKRTALFGMTRTGKSNTVKKVIQATVLMSGSAPYQQLGSVPPTAPEANLDAFTDTGLPKYPVGQIIFDINGEYANANMQDQGTAIFELYHDQVLRYSVLKKEGFKVLKVNFYRDVVSGFELVRNHLANDHADYVKSVASIDLTEPHDTTDHSSMTRYYRKRAAYWCCLHRAGFPVPPTFTVTFTGNKELNALVKANGSLDPSKGITIAEATDWFIAIWDQYGSKFFEDYKKEKGHEWADEDLKALLVFLTRKAKPGGNPSLSGYVKLRDLAVLHTETVDKPFEQEIIEELR